MSLTNPKTLEERIPRLLEAGGVKTTELLAKLGEDGKAPTKQGFYAALRRLRSEDVVVVYKGVAALNVTWIKQMQEVLNRASAAYVGRAEQSEVLALADKESISYSFASIRQLDNFWGHAQNIVVHATPAQEPVYTYDPHYWFLIARPEVERGHMDGINKLGKQFLMTVGGKTPLDKALLSEFDTELRQYHMEKVFDKERYYVVVIGDFIFESVFDESVERIIEDIYAKHTAPNGEVRKEFEPVLEARTRAKLKISRNRTRAKKLKSKFGKNFYVRR